VEPASAPKSRSRAPAHQAQAIAPGGQRPQHKGLDRLRHVLQQQRTQRLERQAQPFTAPFMRGTGDADPARRTRFLQACGDDDTAAVVVAAIADNVAQVDTHAQAQTVVVQPTVIVPGKLVLDSHGALHRLTDTIEHDQERITRCLHQTTPMPTDCRTYQPIHMAQPCHGPDIVAMKQPAVTDQVGIQRSHQPGPIPASPRQPGSRRKARTQDACRLVAPLPGAFE
jgi:hypothetical protein